MAAFVNLSPWGPNGPTRWDKAKWRLRTAATSYRTVLAVATVVIFLHVRWYTVDKGLGPEIASGFGAALVVFGVWVAAFPFIRRGLARKGPAPLRPRDVVLPEFRHFVVEREEERERERTRRDQIDECIVGVALALAGTLLNGYGPLVARLLHLRQG